MKLFLWEDVLTDYTSGVIFAFAETADEARDIIKKDVNCCSSVLKEIKALPQIITEPMGFILWGGS
jgi:hypothetical protein